MFCSQTMWNIYSNASPWISLSNSSSTVYLTITLPEFYYVTQQRLIFQKWDDSWMTSCASSYKIDINNNNWVFFCPPSICSIFSNIFPWILLRCSTMPYFPNSEMVVRWLLVHTIMKLILITLLFSPFVTPDWRISITTDTRNNEYITEGRI